MRTRSLQFVIAFTFLLCASTAANAQPEFDITFNNTGKVTTDFTTNTDTGYAVVIQADNKIVVAGAAGFPNSLAHFALTRYNTDGSLDNSFGTGGRVETDFDANSTDEGAFTAAMQPDGKIIAAGYVSLMSQGPGYFALARYNTDGSLDATFGAGGKVSTSILQKPHYIQDIVIAPDGKIIAGGWFYYSPQSNWQTALIRYNPDGSLDTSFGSGGIVITLLGNGSNDYNITNSVALQPDGKIVTGGSYYPFGSFMAFDMTFRRYNTDGSLDASFAGGGQMVIPSLFSEGINAVAVLPDDKILGAGSSGTSSMADIVLLRLNSDGSSDNSFAQNGRATTSLDVMDSAVAMAAQPNGKITVTGLSRSSPGGPALAAVAAYNADGSLDTSFSNDGKLIFGFGNPSENSGRAIALDSLGRIVIAGSSNDMFAAARLYTRDPVPVSISGRVTTADGRPIKGLEVDITDQSGAYRWTITSPFGYYQFDGVLSGQTYTVSISSKRYTAAPQIIGLNENLTGIDLTGQPYERSGNKNLNLKINEK